MIKFCKRFSAALAAMLIIICAPFCVMAQGKGVITDDAYLFSDSEEASLQSKLDDLSAKTGWIAVIYTNYDGYDEDGIMAHANRYYADRYGKTTDGVMLTVDMAGRAVDFRTKGDAIPYFSDSRVDSLLDDVQYELKNERYYEAAEYFINDVSDCYDEGIPVGESNENFDIQEKEDNPFLYVVKHYSIVILLVSCGISALVVLFVKMRYKKHGTEGTYDLHANSTTNITYSNDTFLHKNVSVTTVSSSSSGSGGSSGSSSGGGGSSGGGSRSF